jgi:hypothetical protein
MPSDEGGIRERDLAMPVNGIIATKEDAESFCGSCVALRSLWEHYRTLFEGSDLPNWLGARGPPALGGPVEFRLASPRKQAAARLRTQWRFSAPLVAEERSPVGLRTGVLAARPRRPEIPEHRDELPSCPC